MEGIIINSADYVSRLVDVIYNQAEVNKSTYCQFIKILLRHCDINGAVIRKNIFPVIREEMKIDNKIIQQFIDRLRNKGHIKTVGVTIYLSSSYLSAKKCDPANGGDGLFIISTLKPLKSS